VRSSTKLYIIGGSTVESTLELTDVPDGPGNDWSWVIRYLFILLPEESNVACFTQPRGARAAFGMCGSTVIGSGRANPHSTSSEIKFFNTSL